MRIRIRHIPKNAMMRLAHRPLFSFVLAACAGLCIGISFHIAVLWFCSIAGIALLLFLTLQARTLKLVFTCGWIAGCVFYGVVFGGLVWALFPFDWYGIEQPLLQLVFVGATWLCASVVMGSVWGFFAFAARLFKTNSLLDALVVPSLWVLCELGSSFVYYFYMLGPGSFFGPHFTFGYLGYLAAEDYTLLQLAAFGGVYLLSFVLVLVSVLIVRSYEGDVRGVQLIALCVLLWVVAHSVFMVTPAFSPKDAASLRVAVVSRYMPPTSEQDDLFEEERYAELLQVILPLRELDMVVLPENAAFLRELLSEEKAHDLATLKHTAIKEEGPVIIDSGDAVVNGVFSAQVTFFDAAHRSFGEKQFLLPFGEYIPYLYQFVLRITGNEDLAHHAVSLRNYIPGDEIALSAVDGISVAVRFCDEAMSPLLFRTQVNEGAQVLVNISSLSWFNGSSFVASHMERIAQVRAVELHRYFVQSGNVAPAFVVNEHGVIEAKTSGKNIEALETDVYGFSDRTLYSRFPLIVVIVSIIFVLMTSIRKFRIIHKKNVTD